VDWNGGVTLDALRVDSWLRFWDVLVMGLKTACMFFLLAACESQSVVQEEDASAFDSGPGPVVEVQEDAGQDDAGESDAGLGSDASVDAGPGFLLVSHERELRGLWVATVNRLDWPPAAAVSPADQQASLSNLVDEAAAAGINALFFQVRASADALYESPLEPWSSAVGGQHPGYDPLATLLTLAHAKGLEVHAWINPYRGRVASLSEHAITYGTNVVMNPGVPAVRQHVVAVVNDILSRYDVDGLHFDDYFYPYPISGTPFPDGATYTAYTQGVAPGLPVLSKLDWRRNNVNQLLKDVMSLVKREHPHVRFGVSPFGIYKPGTPPGIVGLNAYDELGCDAPKWIAEGWVDYLAPQLYWTTNSIGQSYVKLINFWAGLPKENRHVFAGLATSKVAPTGPWPLSEYRAQLTARREQKEHLALGEIHFRSAILLANPGVRSMLKNEFYPRPALLPPLPRSSTRAPDAPQVTLESRQLRVSHSAPLMVRFLVLYQKVASGYRVQKIFPLGTQMALPPGDYAVTAVARGGAESTAISVRVP
jgi:uncharacterized lipoprotein YddW (UPF0748 family)